MFWFEKKKTRPVSSGVLCLVLFVHCSCQQTTGDQRLSRDHGAPTIPADVLGRTAFDRDRAVKSLLESSGEHTRVQTLLFACGSEILPAIRAVYMDTSSRAVHGACETLLRRMTYTGPLFLVRIDTLYSGALPVTAQDLGSAVDAARALVMAPVDSAIAVVDSTTFSPQHDRALVICSSTHSRLSAVGFVFTFVRRGDDWVLVVAESSWVS